MGSMDSMFDAFDNSSVGDLLDIKNSVAFLSRVFGKNIPVFENLKKSKSRISEMSSLRNVQSPKFRVSENSGLRNDNFLDDPSLTKEEHNMEQKLKEMGWNLTLCEERDRLKFNEIGPELRFLSSF